MPSNTLDACYTPLSIPCSPSPSLTLVVERLGVKGQDPGLVACNNLIDHEKAAICLFFSLSIRPITCLFLLFFQRASVTAMPTCATSTQESVSVPPRASRETSVNCEWTITYVNADNTSTDQTELYLERSDTYITFH